MVCDGLRRTAWPGTTVGCRLKRSCVPSLWVCCENSLFPPALPQLLSVSIGFVALHAACLKAGQRVGGEGSIAGSSTETMWRAAVVRLGEAIPLQALFCGDKRCHSPCVSQFWLGESHSCWLHGRIVASSLKDPHIACG